MPTNMAFADQDHKRKAAIFKQSLRLMETAAGVFLQKVPVRDAKRLQTGGDGQGVPGGGQARRRRQLGSGKAGRADTAK